MSRESRRAHRGTRATGQTPTAPRAAPAPPLSRPAWMLLGLLAVTVALVLVSFPVNDTDVWQHLLVGKVIWAGHSIPRTQIWVWPIHGEPYMLPSWLFRVLLYPFWAAGGEAGLLVWRWLAMLAAFGLLWLAARSAGGRGPWVLPALLWCLLLYRYRSQARPETLTAVLMAAQLWLLEKRRDPQERPGRIDPAWGVVPLALLWVNAHISFILGWLITGIHLVASLAPVPSRRPPAPRTLLLVLLASVAVSVVHPFGWRALAEPVDYYTIWRHEPIYRVIGELQPVVWSLYAPTLLPYGLSLAAALAVWRSLRHELDLVEILILAVFIPQTLSSQRFIGTLGVLLAPFFARDLDRTLSNVRVPVLRRSGPRAAAVALSLVALTASAERTIDMRPGSGFQWSGFPVAACDWMEAHGVRGRGFNSFSFGGYMLWRFWPDPGRLPFMDIHQSGTRQDRALAAYALTDRRMWRLLDDERRFDYALVTCRQFSREDLLDFMDADTTTWRLVFVDDAAALFLRRNGAMAALAERERYHFLPAGQLAIARLGQHPASDTLLRAELRRELGRSVRESPWSSVAHNMLSQLALVEGRPDEAARETRLAEASVRAKPGR